MDPNGFLFLFSMVSIQFLSVMSCLTGRNGTRMGYCLFLIAPWMLRYIMNWLWTSSEWIQSAASLILNSSRKLPQLRRRMAFISISMLSGLPSALMATSTQRSMASGV
jgi:hypothetical protein